MQESADASCAPVQATRDLPGWLICQADDHSGLIVAVATLGLFVVAVLRLRRNGNGADGRPDVDEGPGRAAARIANLAFPVRRTLAKSLGEGWRLDDEFMYQRDRAREIQRGFVEHEPRVEDMLHEANRAPSETADAARRAARLFWDAADGVNDMAAFESQHMGDSPADDVLDGYREAHSSTEDCVEMLRRLDAPVREAGDG